MRLPGTDEWSSEDIASRIAFERNVPEAVVPILSETADSKGFVNSGAMGRFLPSNSIFALGRAAELAFSTEHLDLGFQICREILVHDYAMPRTPLQFAFYATVGVLLNLFKIILTPYGAAVSELPESMREKFKEQANQRLAFVAWPSGSSIEALKLIKLLLPAAAASGTAAEALQTLSSIGESAIKVGVRSAVFASAEYEAISATNHPQVDFDHLAGAIQSLETAYQRQLRLLRSDAFYWRTLRPRGSLVDWRLLALWVFMYRYAHGGGIAERVRPLSDEASYIRFLARDFANRTSPLQAE